MCCGLRKLFGFSWDRESEECRHQTHMQVLWMKTFTSNAVAFSNSHTCLSIPVVIQPWLGIPVDTDLHKKCVGVPQKSPLVVGFPKRMRWNLPNKRKKMSQWYCFSIHVFCTEQFLWMRLFILQMVKTYRFMAFSAWQPTDSFKKEHTSSWFFNRPKLLEPDSVLQILTLEMSQNCASTQ